MITRNNNFPDESCPLTFSFAACGWLKMYQFGVALALKHYGLDKNAKFVGSSAGALTAAALVLDVDIPHLKDYAMDCLRDVRSPGLHSKPFQLRKYITKIVDETLGPNEFLDKEKALSEQLEVVVTVLPGCHTLRYSEYKSYDHFKDVLLASCTAPPIAGFPFILDGQICADGGLSDFQPLIDENTITISPFYFHRADIRPSRYVPVWWAAYPGSDTEFEELFRLGYNDAVDWMQSKGYRPQKGFANSSAWMNSLNIDRVTNGDAYRSNQRKFDAKQPLKRFQSNTVEVADTVKGLLRRTNTDMRLVCNQTKTAVAHERYRALHEFGNAGRSDRKAHARPMGDGTSIHHSPKSDIFELLFLGCVLLFVRPLTYIMLYLELLTITYVGMAQVLLHDLVWGRKSSHRSVGQILTRFWRQLSIVNQFVGAAVNPTVELDAQSLFQQSVVYRVMAYAI